MADIRQSTQVIDDFDRADVNPIPAPWAKADTSWQYQKIKDGGLQGNPGDGVAYKTDFGPFDGDDAEVWGTTGSGIDLTEAWRIGLGKTVGGSGTFQGYLVLSISGTGSVLRKYTAFSSFSVLDSDGTIFDDPDGGALVRRNGNDVECWIANPPYTTWTLLLSATDTSYTTGLWPCLGISTDEGGNPGWNNFGGGPAVTHRSEIYRWVSN